MSASFRFRLEPVRRVRQRREDDARAELADALRREDEARRSHADAVARDRAARGHLRRTRRDATLTGAQLRAQEAWMARAAGEIASRELVLDRQVEESLARRALLADAARERQALDRLRQRRLEAHEAAVARAEQAHLDEIALALHRRSAA